MSHLLVEGMLADVDGVAWGRIRIEDGAIVAVGDLPGAPDLVFGDDCLVFAGMGDVHIHAREDVSRKECHKETFATAAAAALHGGVIHVADMPNNPCPPIDDATYSSKESLVRRGNFPVHFTLYAGVGPDTRPLHRLAPYKVYMAHSHGPLSFTNLEDLDRSLAYYRGQYVSFHCEDPLCLASHATATSHELRRPTDCEVIATQNALELIEKHQLIGKLCHYSAGEGLAFIRAAKARRLPVSAEATPHHLYFDTSTLSSKNRVEMVMNPPLRTAADRWAMIDALRDGTIDFLATDHAPHTPLDKAKGAPGLPHLDTYGPFVCWLMDELGIPPARIAEVCAANPGRFVNAFSHEQFGRLLPGYVGSLTVLNVKKRTLVHRAQLQTLCGWSPFEGTTFPGAVESVIVRGQAIV